MTAGRGAPAPRQVLVLPARFGASLAASTLLHALVLGAALLLLRAPVRPALIVFPVSLVGEPGGGAEGGGAPGAAAPAPAPPAASEVAPAPAPPTPPRPQEQRARAAHAQPASAPAVARDNTGANPTGADGVGTDPTGAGGAGGWTGGGSGAADGAGDGSGGARVAYGANPLPPYPTVARRLGREGVVLLEVLVAPDGHAADVRLVRSSGFAPLDDSALTTVRERWRFIPATRGTTPVESRVTVPVRFRLEDDPD